MEFNKIRFIMMGPVFTILYSIYHYYLLKFLFDLFYPISFNTLIALVLIYAIISLSSIIIELKKSNIITRFLMTICEIWKWASLMYLFVLIFLYILQLYIDLPIAFILSTIAIVPLLGIYEYYKAHKIIIKEHNLYFKNLKSEIAIAHLSDIHVGSIRNESLLKDITKNLNEIHKRDIPTIAIISGDLADGTNKINKDSFLPLKESKIPIIFTPGNHDYYPGIENVFTACKNANIAILDNESQIFKDLHIFGLSFSFDKKINNKKIKINKDKLNVLIYHIPEDLTNLGFDLQLSGHTHGGQFYPDNFFVKLPFPNLKGIFKNKNSYLSVSTGIGTMGPPMRLGTDSEIIVLNLKNKD